MRRPGPLVGALVGLLLTLPLVALLFLAWRLAGTPFLPFDLFDGLARVLPGPVVTFGIDALVATIGALGLGSVDEAAKTAEGALAIGLFLAGGAALGAIAFAAFAGRGDRSSARPAALLGAIAGILLLLASLAVNPDAAARPVASGVPIVLAFLAWGAALGRSRDRLARAGSDVPASAAVAPAEVERLDRRRFLVRLGGTTATLTVVGAGVGALLRDGGPTPTPAEGAATPGWSAANPLPNADASLEPAPGTRPEYTRPEEHYRIDVNMIPPRVDPSTWTLRVDGLVSEPRELSLEDLRAYEPQHLFVTLSCISNPLGGDLMGTTRWTGVPLARLLPDLGLRPEATHLRIASVDGFFEYLSVATALVDERVMLAYAWDGRPLPARNGFPLRLYVPDVYGMKQPKWIERIEAVDGWDAGYWVERGWDAEAPMQATSVVDAVAVDAIATDAEGVPRVPIGGIAHAGARGIDRVEVRVDDGEWREARLREPLSGLTWVVWRYDWPFEPGEHRFAVRCVDGNGTPQVVERTPPHPDGATGLVEAEASL